MNANPQTLNSIVLSILELRALFNGRVIAPDDLRYERVLQAMLKMNRIIVADLERAHNNQ